MIAAFKPDFIEVGPVRDMQNINGNATNFQQNVWHFVAITKRNPELVTKRSTFGRRRR